jgi:hypothetical protein
MSEASSRDKTTRRRLFIAWMLISGATIVLLVSASIYTAGQHDVRSHTVVRVFSTAQGFGPYLGDCASLGSGQVACAVDYRREGSNDEHR